MKRRELEAFWREIEIEPKQWATDRTPCGVSQPNDTDLSFGGLR